MDDLVTVIVPAYNASDTIMRCIGSITGQTYHNLQIVVVDDGSTDGTGDICVMLADGDPRVEVVRRDNGGVSAARNAGLRHARGEWISWVDADDYVSPYYIEDLLADAQDADMVICRYVRMDENGGPASFTRAAGAYAITGGQACLRRFGRDLDLYNRCWGKIYRIHIWDGVTFPDGKIAEDLHVSFALLHRAERIAVIDARLYAYVISSGGYTNGAFTLQRFDALDAWREGVRFFTSAGEAGLADIARRTYCTRSMDARYICKINLPREREVRRRLRLRSIDAYDDVKKITRYTDCNALKTFVYRVKFFTGRWCYPLYALCFVRFSRWRTYI